MLCCNAQRDLKQCHPGDACSVSADGGGYIIGHPNKDVHLTDLAEVPIIRMYGVTESGAIFDSHVQTEVVKSQRVVCSSYKGAV